MEKIHLLDILTDDMLPLEDGCVLSLGNFDGVHIGHAGLIHAQTAVKGGKKAVVFTFAQHPLNMLTDKKPVKYIIGSTDKMKYLAELGADAIYFADFNELKDYEPERFIDEVLVKLFRPSTVVCGENFSFGKGKSGSSAYLKQRLEQKGINCIIVPPVTSDGRVVSSTLIRQLITDGRVEAAETLLGRKYSIILPVIHGRAYGRTIGVPTINQLFPPDRIVPKFGVYACRCEIDGELYEGIANVGVRPTIKESTPEPLCETHIFEFSELLYDKAVRVIFCKLIRDEKKFNSLDELIKQIKIDIDDCKAYFRQEERNIG